MKMNSEEIEEEIQTLCDRKVDYQKMGGPPVTLSMIAQIEYAIKVLGGIKAKEFKKEMIQKQSPKQNLRKKLLCYILIPG